MRWWFWVVWEWTLIVLTLAAVSWQWWLFVPAIIVLASRIHALLVLGHEVVHSPDERVWAAKFLCFYPAFVDYKGYKKFHLDHHKYVGSSKDPEVKVRETYTWAWSNLTKKKKILLLVMDMFGINIPETFGTLKAVESGYTWIRGLWVCALATGLALISWPLLVLWVWSILTGLMAVVRTRMWYEHIELPPGETRKWTAKWWQRALFCPHYIWKHWSHHKQGNWHKSCWSI